MAVDSRYGCLLSSASALPSTWTAAQAHPWCCASTTSLWKESFHLLGYRYSWKYVDGRQVLQLLALLGQCGPCIY